LATALYISYLVVVSVLWQRREAAAAK